MFLENGKTICPLGPVASTIQDITSTKASVASNVAIRFMPTVEEVEVVEVNPIAICPNSRELTL